MLPFCIIEIHAFASIFIVFLGSHLEYRPKADALPCSWDGRTVCRNPHFVQQTGMIVSDHIVSCLFTKECIGAKSTFQQFLCQGITGNILTAHSLKQSLSLARKLSHQVEASCRDRCCFYLCRKNKTKLGDICYKRQIRHVANQP